MNTLETIHARRSIRKYKTGAAVAPEDLRQILEAAMMAPSACNTRPWEFVVVESEETKDQIMTIHPYTSMLSTASLAIVICGRPDLQKGISEGYWPQDCGAAAQNLLLAATELGYGTCWCGCYPKLERAAELQKILGVNSMPFCIIALGKADEAPAARGFFDESRVTYLR